MYLKDSTHSTNDSRRLLIAFLVVLTFVLLLWLIKLIEYFIGSDLTQFGIYPRRLDGLSGVLFAPFIHGSIAHLFANSAPIIIIGTLLVYGFPRSAVVLIPIVYLIGGLAVWLFAREAYHIGASGIVFGMLFFVFTIGVMRWEQRTIALSLVVFLLYGGMISGVIPGEENVSFESHLSGAIIGIVMALLLKHFDPKPPTKQYSWEIEEDDTESADGSDHP
ncbi:MAG: rhomboid family intramembrane serine protease [Gammaproteobacteria bacterium]|nr:rhomboid family intramembrane serine protease [Gammaproteobacteria bacterium]